MKKVVTIITVIVTLTLGFFCEFHFQKADLAEIGFDGVLGFNGQAAHAVWDLPDGRRLVVLHDRKGGTEKAAYFYGGATTTDYLSCGMAKHSSYKFSLKPAMQNTGVSWHIPTPWGFVYGGFCRLSVIDAADEVFIPAQKALGMKVTKSVSCYLPRAVVATLVAMEI